MGTIRYAIAAGIGYYAGQPDGRRHLATLRRRAVEFARGPEVRRLRERGSDLLGDGARIAVAKARTRKDSAGAAPDGEYPATTRRRVLRGWSSRRRPRPDSAAAADPAARTDVAHTDTAAGSNGTTAAEDPNAALLGLSTPPPAAGTRPATSPEDGS